MTFLNLFIKCLILILIILHLIIIINFFLINKYFKKFHFDAIKMSLLINLNDYQ